MINAPIKPKLSFIVEQNFLVHIGNDLVLGHSLNVRPAWRSFSQDPYARSSMGTVSIVVRDDRWFPKLCSTAGVFGAQYGISKVANYPLELNWCETGLRLLELPTLQGNNVNRTLGVGRERRVISKSVHYEIANQTGYKSSNNWLKPKNYLPHWKPPHSFVSNSNLLAWRGCALSHLGRQCWPASWYPPKTISRCDRHPKQTEQVRKKVCARDMYYEATQIYCRIVVVRGILKSFH